MPARIIKCLIEEGNFNLYYDIDEDCPNPGSINNVFLLLEFLKTKPEAKILLIGYTDGTNCKNNNQGLSKIRTSKLYTFLIVNGIEKTRIRVLDISYNINTSGIDLSERVSVILE